MNKKEIINLIEKFKVEQLPDRNNPYHFEAEIASGLKHFENWIQEQDVKSDPEVVDSNIVMSYLKKEYFKMMCNKLSLSKEDLTDNELTLISSGFELFDEKMEEIKLLNDELRRISIELANIKSYISDFDDDRRNNNQFYENNLD